MMSKVIWTSGVLVLVLWSLVVWAIAFLFTSSADFVGALTALWSRPYPEVQLTISSVSALLAHFGMGVVWFVWATGGVLILFCTWLAVQLGQGLREGLARLAPQASKAWDAVRQRLEGGTRSART
jgi:hypothetical protein